MRRRRNRNVRMMVVRVRMRRRRRVMTRMRKKRIGCHRVIKLQGSQIRHGIEVIIGRKIWRRRRRRRRGIRTGWRKRM
jgi:hypothetical protein